MSKCVKPGCSAAATKGKWIVCDQHRAKLLERNARFDAHWKGREFTDQNVLTWARIHHYSSK